MKTGIKIGITVGLGVLAYFLFFKKDKKEQLKNLLTKDNKLKESLTDSEVNTLKDILLSIKTQSKLKDWIKAFDELFESKIDFYDTIETLLPESVQLSIIADWSDKGIINVDALTEEEKESGKMAATFNEKVARQQHNLSELGFNTASARTLLKAITEDYKIIFNENTLKVTSFEEINEVDPFWTADQIEALLKNPKFRKYVCDDWDENAPEYQLIKIMFEPLDERIKKPINNNVVYVDEEDIDKIKKQDYE